MFSKNKRKKTVQIPTSILLSVDRQAPVYHRINIEYFILYHGIAHEKCKEVVLRGLTNNLTISNGDLRHKSTRWKPEHDKILDSLALKSCLDIKHQQKQLPIAALRSLPLDIKATQQILLNTPNNHLCHFHLGWLYSIAKNYNLAERHFNVAALQSQAVNPQFSSFAYRHLANVRFKNGKYPLALLAIEAACGLSQSYNSELQFERLQLLARAQKTTQALAHLAILINKSPHYEIFSFCDKNIQNNPSLRRIFDQLKEKHIKNIQHQLMVHWKNDPLHLLNLDEELGQKNSLQTLRSRQQEMLSKLSPLLIFNEKISSELIQKLSHTTVTQSLNKRKQDYIHRIEGHQERAGEIHTAGQWMLYTAVLSIIALGLSYAISATAYQFNFHWPINIYLQSVVLACAAGLVVIGTLLLHFTPRKLTDLLRQKQKLEDFSLRLGVSSG